MWVSVNWKEAGEEGSLEACKVPFRVGFHVPAFDTFPLSCAFSPPLLRIGVGGLPFGLLRWLVGHDRDADARRLCAHESKRGSGTAIRKKATA